MITFSQLGNYGRFGNQLFQYAAIKSLSIYKNYQLILPNFSTKSWHGQQCLLNDLNITDDQTNKFDNLIKIEESNEFSENFYSLPDNIDLHGFFQDVRYFERHIAEIKKCFEFKENIKNKIYDRFKFYSNFRKNNNLISIHIRLGDNIRENNNFYNQDWFHFNYLKYIESSINLFNDDTDVLVFTGGSRCASGQEEGDVEICKKILKQYNKNFIFSQKEDTIIDFGLMTLCDQNIISPLSTFSLWVGYLKNENNRVIAPKNFYLEDNNKTNKLYLKNWTLV